jgi:hypothetical protein
MTLIADLEYFAPSIFYFSLSRAKHGIFDIYEPYRKMSFRNRCTLAGANGPIHLSVPLVGGRNQKTLMKDVRILERENWQARHWKTITSLFNKSPWFDHYRHDLEALYEKRFEFLIDWNLACFEWVADKMAIETGVSLSEKPFDTRESGGEEIEDWRGRLMPATINKEFPESKRYPQVFEDRLGFLPNLSVLDYLFCAGNKLPG